MFSFSFSPRIKKVLTRVASGTIPANRISVRLDDNSKRVYTITYQRKDEFGDVVGEVSVEITGALLKKIRDDLEAEYAALTAEFDESMAVLAQTIAVFRET